MIKIVLPFLTLLPLALLAEHQGANPLVIFSLAGAGIIPFAALLTAATEAIAERVGPIPGALITAAFGNAAELIIAINGIRNGLIEVVKASITGAILNDLLLVVGVAMLAGGLRHGEQCFQPTVARANGAAMMLAVIALALPASLISTSGIQSEASIHSLSLFVAAILIIIYWLTLMFSLFSSRVSIPTFCGQPALESPGESTTESQNLIPWLLLLLGSTAGIAVQSEIFVTALEPATSVLGFSTLFTGVLIIPIVGGFSEYIPAVNSALKNNMDLPLSLAVGSSLLMALLIAPALVLYSNAIGQPMNLDFSSFEVITLVLSIIIVNLVSMDARSNWLEGALLMATYLIIGAAFFYFPA